MGRVALIGENSIKYIEKLLDIWNGGDCAVLLDWRIPFETAVKMMREADVARCYVERRLLEKIGTDNIIDGDIELIGYENVFAAAQEPPVSKSLSNRAYHQSFALNSHGCISYKSTRLVPVHKQFSCLTKQQ